jgi:general secretion pathway protein G
MTKATKHHPLSIAGGLAIGRVILYWLATPIDKGQGHWAREAALIENLFTLRESIRQYKIDLGRGPEKLEDLVTAGYLRRIPAAPITETTESWIIYYQPAATGVVPQISNVRSGAKGKGPRGVPYFDH